MRTSRPHLLLCGWYRPGTGFTRVLEALLPELASHFSVTWLGVGYDGPAIDHPSGARVLPTNVHGGDIVGAIWLRDHWPDLRPDALFALNDLWYLSHYNRELAQLAQQHAVPMVGYLPLDGRDPPAAALAELGGFRRLYTYTQTAAADLREVAACEVRVLGHGVDRRRFTPALDLAASDLLGQRMRLAQSWFDLPEPAFVVLNAARPDPRKHLRRSLEGFARFARGRDDVRLCLHHAFAEPELGERLDDLVTELQLQPWLLRHPREPGVVTDTQLAGLYNACAVGVNTAYGEGFGLVSFEHAACGVPQILPDQLALAELWGDAAERLPASPVRWWGSPLTMVDVQPQDLARALTRWRDEPQAYAEAALRAWRRSQRGDLDWDALADQLCTELLHLVFNPD
ncbi:MAG: glycosyltransferase [Xanthomonadales bacterium]|nr:glycosyltransferase [Xanthomonadales bacterium]